MDETRKKLNPLPIWFFIVIIAGIVGLYFLASLPLNTFFPKAVKIEDEITPTGRFVGERAYNHVKYLSNTIGPRLVGTESNIVHTIGYILNEIYKIKNAANQTLVKIEVDQQSVSGSFFEEWNSYKSLYTYEDVQNIVVKVTNLAHEKEENWILFNSHFDTVPMSPGAGDDGSMVGVMLELLRILSQQVFLKHPVVFLFNGCEENSLQASHGFITKHRWAKNIRLLLNLDAAGPSGKELMFQTSPKHAWLMESYSKSVPHPFAVSVAEELYHTGLVPSDTDFTQFRKYADPNLAAFDFAYIQDGYFYHTKNDSIDYITMEQLQHTGDNLLALLKEVDTRKELDEIDKAAGSHANPIFYDFLGIWLIQYTRKIGIIINVTVVIGTLVAIALNQLNLKLEYKTNVCLIICEYVTAVVIQLLGIVFGFGCAILLAFIFEKTDKTMIWYANYWFLYSFYFLLVFSWMIIWSRGYISAKSKSFLPHAAYVQLHLQAFATILMTVLIILTSFHIRSAFVPMIALLFYSITTLLNSIFRLDRKGNNFIYLHLIGQIIPITYYFYTMKIFYSAFLPMLGRSYSSASFSPEYLVVIITGAYAILITGFIAPLTAMFRYATGMISTCILFLVIPIILMFTSLTFPYKEAAPQRFIVYHMQLKHFDLENNLQSNEFAYYVHPHDRSGTKYIQEEIPLLQLNAVSMSERCKKTIFCGIPHYQIFHTGNVQNSIWVRNTPKPPKFTTTPTLIKIEQKSITDRKEQYTFSITDTTSHMSLHLSPMPLVKITSWNFVPKIEEELKMVWNERDAYFINLIRGLESTPDKTYEIILEIERPLNYTATKVLDFAIAAQFIHRNETVTTEFKDFLFDFPKWTTLQYWTNYYANYEF